MTLPLIVSVPHAGHVVPPEAEPYCALDLDDILDDGDGGAREIYDFPHHVAHHVTTPIARAIVDMNRAPDDIRKDGVVKTHTCWDVPVYERPLPRRVVDRLIDHHHQPYHRLLSRVAGPEVLAGVDCHTMAATAPPEAPDPGATRPRICLSNGNGTLPDSWFRSLAAALERSFGTPVSLNRPFRGGYIVRAHSLERPWVQLELSRDGWLDLDAKRERVLDGLGDWCDSLRVDVHATH